MENVDITKLEWEKEEIDIKINEIISTTNIEENGIEVGPFEK